MTSTGRESPRLPTSRTAERLRAAARAQSPQRRRLWAIVATLLVLGPLLFNLARDESYSASVKLHPAGLPGVPPPRDLAYYQSLLADPELRVNMVTHVGVENAGADEYERVTFRPDRDGVVLVEARAATPQRVAEFVEALGPQLAGASKREAGRFALVAERATRERLRTERSARTRRELRRALAGYRELQRAPRERLVLGEASGTPPVDGWADRIADAMPGEFPARPSPLWAAFSGLLVAVTLWLIGLVLFPPGRAPPPGPRRGTAARSRTRDRLAHHLPEPPALRVGWLAGIALVPAITFGMILSKGINAPFGDQWEGLARLFTHADAGLLGFGDFWEQHNEHRPIIPRTIQFVLAYVTNWNIQVELILDFGVAAATFVLLTMALRRSLEGTAYLLAGLATATIFFSPIQYENWLWGWQLEWFLANLAAVAAVWALTVTIDRSPRRGLATGAAWGVVATFSLGQGLLVWPVGLVILLLRRRPWRLWLALSAAVPLVYFAGYDEPGYHPSKTLFLEQPFEFLQFLLLYFGRSLAFSQATGMFVGALLVAGFAAGIAYVAVNHRDRALIDATAPWVGIGLYAFGSGVITAVSRLGFGTDYAGISRYSTMAALFAIATMALLLTILRSEPDVRVLPASAGRWGPAVLAVPLALAALGNVPNALREADRFADDLAADAACSRTVQTPSDPCMRRPQLAPNRAERVGTIKFLRERGWAGY